jgi:hypothetical protein
MDSLFSVQAEVVKVESKARGVARIVFDTQEGLTMDARAKIMKWHNEQPGWLTFSQERIEPDYIANLPKLTFEKGEKSPSQRLHATLYVLWEQKGKPTDTFEEFYRIAMEKYINNVKEQLT